MFLLYHGDYDHLWIHAKSTWHELRTTQIFFVKNSCVYLIVLVDLVVCLFHIFWLVTKWVFRNLSWQGSWFSTLNKWQFFTFFLCFKNMSTESWIWRQQHLIAIKSGEVVQCREHLVEHLPTNLANQ